MAALSGSVPAWAAVGGVSFGDYPEARLRSIHLNIGRLIGIERDSLPRSEVERFPVPKD